MEVSKFENIKLFLYRFQIKLSWNQKYLWEKLPPFKKVFLNGVDKISAILQSRHQGKRVKKITVGDKYFF